MLYNVVADIEGIPDKEAQSEKLKAEKETSVFKRNDKSVDQAFERK